MVGQALWLAVHLENLPFTALDKVAVSELAAVAEARGGDLRIVAASAAASALGIEPGLALDAALALVESLQLLERSPRAEREELESLAAWATRFTPAVSLEPPDALLLEVGASLKLFGGPSTLKASVAAELERRRLSFHIACAPTALASLWLARAHGEDAGAEELAGRLSRLDLGATRWPEKIQARLRGMGVRTVGDCLRLPRDGFALRASESYLRALDRALGKQRDVRRPFKPSQRLRSRIDFAEATEDSAFLVRAAQSLIERLCDALRARQAEAGGLEITFHHLRLPPTVERIALVEPTHEPARFLRLIEEKLQRASLPAAVTALVIKTARLQTIDGLQSISLFSRNARAGRTLMLSELIELLRTRFGDERVHRIGLVAEHRPEAAWIKLLDDAPAAPVEIPPTAGQRPLWLLPAPLPVSDSDPRYGGPLRLQSGPERIETGWWDDADIARDYYRACTARGERLWVFKERLEQSWYLHGIFG
jgi:protein ImuB